MKTCTKCLQSKSLENYYFRKTTEKPYPRCKSCVREDQLVYAAAHRVEARNRKKEWYSRNQDRAIAYSSEWNQNNKSRRRITAAAAQNRRRARRKNSLVETYSRIDIFDRDNGVCYLCKESIDITLEWPDPRSFTVDHIQPISKGGSDTPSNVSASHWICNLSKGNR